VHREVRGQVHRRELVRQMPPIGEPQHPHHAHHANHRHRGFPGQERAVADPREAADQHVLRISGQRRDASHVGGGRERQEVRHGWEPELPGHRQHHGGEHEPDHVVDEERRENPGREGDHRQEAYRAAGPPDRPVRHQVEEPGQPEVRRDDHHAEQEHQRVGVDGSDRLLPGQHPGDHHDGRADDRHAGPVDAEAREVAEREAQIRARERDQRDEVNSGMPRSIRITAGPLQAQREHRLANADTAARGSSSR
jgi:hypothetical protein